MYLEPHFGGNSLLWSQVIIWFWSHILNPLLFWNFVESSTTSSKTSSATSSTTSSTTSHTSFKSEHRVRLQVPPVILLSRVNIV
ncbi:unnamed protein product, partial [Nesidiocoris tenuis]